MLVTLGQVAVALNGALPGQFAVGIGAEWRVMDLRMELEDGVTLSAEFLRTHRHGHFHMVNIPLAPLSTIHPGTAVTHEFFFLEVVQGVHHGSSRTHMGAVGIYQVVVKENLVGLDLDNQVLNHLNVGIGDFPLAMLVVDIERHAQVINVLHGDTHLSASHHGFAQHDGPLEVSHIAGVVAGGSAVEELLQRLLNELEAGALKTLGQSVGQQDTAHQVFVANGNIGIGLEGDAHIMTLLHQAPHSAAHRHDGIVGMGTEDEHSLGVGRRSFGAVRVVGIGLAARPPRDGVLQVVEYLDVDIIG